ncbi:MAG: MFS transporter, partial [Chitinophagaceae bacterium]
MYSFGLFLVMPTARQDNYLLFVIIFSQFAGTSLWFAGNAVIDQLSKTADHGKMTAVVQFGFIAGTLLFSLFTIADRFSSKAIFFLSSILAATANLAIIWLGRVEWQLSLLRFATGFFLAGIYPIGMKIAANLFPQKLGKALGFLVGALVLGTAFPHFVRSQLNGIHWKVVLITTSVLATLGGLLIALQIPSNKKSSAAARKPDYLAAVHVFRSPNFRSVAFGYFGHMWELYAFWSILPFLFAYHNQIASTQANVYLWSFIIIAVGAAGCAIGGVFSQK